MGALGFDDAVDKVVQLNLAVGVVHPVALSLLRGVLGEAGAASSPVAFGLIARAQGEVLALVANGAVLVGNQTGSLGVRCQVAIEAKLAVPPLILVAHGTLLAGLVVGCALVIIVAGLLLGDLQASAARLTDVVRHLGDHLVTVVNRRDSCRTVLVERDRVGACT